MFLALEQGAKPYDLSISAGTPLKAPPRQPCLTRLLVRGRDKGGRASTLWPNMRTATCPVVPPSPVSYSANRADAQCCGGLSVLLGARFMDVGVLLQCLVLLVTEVSATFLALTPTLVSLQLRSMHALRVTVAVLCYLTRGQLTNQANRGINLVVQTTERWSTVYLCEDRLHTRCICFHRGREQPRTRDVQREQAVIPMGCRSIEPVAEPYLAVGERGGGGGVKVGNNARNTQHRWQQFFRLTCRGTSGSGLLFHPLEV